MKSRYKTARCWLLFWALFVGIGAVAGAICMIVDPSGRTLHMDALLPYFQVLPFASVLFRDLAFSGWALLTVNGLSNLTAAGLLLAKKKAGVILGGAFGMTLILWICIQFYIFPLNFMSTAYFLLGLAQAVTGIAAWIFQKQEAFSVDTAAYPNIGKDKRRLVAYFSRMGYVKKMAYETANQTGATIYEIKATERTEGTLGFWWCGRFAMHRRDMPIEPIGIDLTQYAHVTVCSPIWVFSLASPVRSFLRQSRGKIKQYDCLFVHHTNGRYQHAAKEATQLLGLPPAQLINVRCRQGTFRPLSRIPFTVRMQK